MPEPRFDLALFSTDARLVELVQQCRPATARLRIIEPGEWESGIVAGACECWIDLDTHPPPLETQPGRRVYFHSDLTEVPSGWPTGTVLRKPCTRTIIELLWAGVPLGGSSRAESPAPLPGWIVAFHDLDLKGLCGKLIGDLGRRFGFQHASLYLYCGGTDLLTLAATNHPRAIDLAIALDGPVQSILTTAARRRTLFLTDDVELEAPRDGWGRAGGPGLYRDGACMVAPLVCDGVLQGVLAFSERLPSANARPDRWPLRDIFEFLARSLAHARIFEQTRSDARIDDLTGLANFRAFREALEGEIRRAERYASPLALVLIDLDQLKQVNDCLGHPAGNEALRATAARITRFLRQFDTAARIGGDEFGLVLPGSDVHGARAVALRILRAIREDPPRVGDLPVSISASVGIGQHERGWDFDRYFGIVDGALYLAKRQGRDRVVCAPREPTQPDAPVRAGADRQPGPPAASPIGAAG